MPDSPVPPRPRREPPGPHSPENGAPPEGSQRPVIRPAVSEGWRHSENSAPREPEGETYYDYIDRHSGQIPVQPPLSASQPQAAPAPPRRRFLWFTVLAVVLAVALVVGFIFVASPDNDVEVTETSPTAEGPGAAAPRPSASADDEPGAALESLAQEGTQAAERELDGQWVVQLSAKQDGLQADGRTWDDAAILEEFEGNRERYPEAILLRSSDWSTFQLPGFWITVLATPYEDPADALAWCNDAGLSRDNCFAKKISSTESYEDSTRLNP